MIRLHLGIGKGDVETLNFKTFNDLDYFVSNEERLMIDGVWLATSGGTYSDVFVTDNIDHLRLVMNVDLWEELTQDLNAPFHIHHYESFEDAYKVALDMKEGHELCYNL